MRHQASFEYVILLMGAVALTLAVGTTLVDTLETLSMQVEDIPQGRNITYPQEVLKKNPSISTMYVDPTSPYDDERVTLFCEGPEMVKVELYINNNLVRSCSGSSCSSTEGPFRPGDYTFTCIVQDEKGNREDATIYFTVSRRPDTEPPVITGFTVSGAGNDVTVSCHATDNKNVKSITLYRDEGEIKRCVGGTVDNPKTSLSCEWRGTLPDGSYTFSCEVIDSANDIVPTSPPNIATSSQSITLPIETPVDVLNSPLTQTVDGVTVSLRIDPKENVYINEDYVRIGCAATSSNPTVSITSMKILDYSYRKGSTSILRSWSGNERSYYISSTKKFTVPWYHDIKCVVRLSNGKTITVEDRIHIFDRRPSVTLTSIRNGYSSGWKGRASTERNPTTFEIKCVVEDPAGIREAYLKEGRKIVDRISNPNCKYDPNNPTNSLPPEGITQCPTKVEFSIPPKTYGGRTTIICEAIDVYGNKTTRSNTIDVCVDACDRYWEEDCVRRDRKLCRPPSNEFSCSYYTLIEDCGNSTSRCIGAWVRRSYCSSWYRPWNSNEWICLRCSSSSCCTRWLYISRGCRDLGAVTECYERRWTSRRYCSSSC